MHKNFKKTHSQDGTRDAPQARRAMIDRSLLIKKGESLVEVIMAIFVVTIGAAVATSLIISALQSNEFSRDNLIATNLAVEGVEAMRAIRDSNWLKFSYDRVDCWNQMPGSDCKNQIMPIGSTNGTQGYTVDLDLTANNYKWGLTLRSAPLDLSQTNNSNNAYQLSYYDIDPSDSNASTGHDILAASNISVPMGVTNNGLSNFYRMVQITYAQTNPPTPPCSISTGQGCEEMDVISTVQWLSQGTVHQVVLQTKLTNYQKIKVQP